MSGASRARPVPATTYRVRVAVAVTDEALGEVEAVAGRCRALGFHHTSTLHSVGVLTGSIEARRLGRLGRLRGVAAVEIADVPGAETRVPS